MTLSMHEEPFDHWIIDDFFSPDKAQRITEEFPAYDDERWYFYENAIENKKTLQDWLRFPPEIYQTLQDLCSNDFIETIKSMTGIKNLYPDYGLHGGGLHMHGRGGNLNIHKDYSIHPRLKMQRKLNLIVYMSDDWDPSWGGGLELWSNNPETNKPKELVKTIEPKFNRAILFDTTQDSWHGLPKPLTCPDGKYRKSLAVYYLTDVDENTEERYRALFVPTEEQLTDPEIVKLCKERSK